MNCCVYLKDKKTLENLRSVLSKAFHSTKAKVGVDEMLIRLYAPILWRNLKAANPNGDLQLET